jgi:hypothetical protein
MSYYGLVLKSDKKIKASLSNSPLFNLNTQNYEKTTKTILFETEAGRLKLSHFYES